MGSPPSDDCDVIDAGGPAPLALVVDDNEDERLLMQLSLETAGFDVIEACDGEEALACFVASTPDIVLMDVLMPRLDGFGACRAIRALPRGRDTPVLLVTGLNDVESIDRAYRAGATDFVTKPSHGLILGRRARYMLRGARAIQASRRQRETLAARNAELERLRVELEASNRELESLNEMKSEFVSLVSHELRTPLTAVKSFTELMLDDPHDPDVDTRVQYLSIIDTETERLERLISDLLDLQKIDAGKMAWRDARVDVATVTRETVDTMRGAYASKGLALGVSGPQEGLEVVVDPDRLRQVVHNLLSNALKFTEAGEVSVSLSLAASASGPRGGSIVRVAVRDTGPGLAPEQCEKIFDAFYQVDSSAQRVQRGSGLGLSICRRIVAHYGGRVWAEGTRGGGCTVSFELPALGHERVPEPEVDAFDPGAGRPVEAGAAS